MIKKIQLASLILFIALITLMHNIVSLSDPLYLNIYQRLYYIPIIFSSYWFGLKGALITSIISTFLYPHKGHFHWPDNPFFTMNQYAEMIMFNVIAIVTGLLSDHGKRQRRKYEKTASELKEAYQKLQNSFEQVRRADRLSALGALSAGMAHEIRNPLSSIKGSLEIIEEDYKAGSKKFEFIEIIKKEISRLDKIISEFLTYAKPSAPNKRFGNINKIIGSVVQLLNKEAKRREITIEQELMSDLPEIKVDSEKIKQAILNVTLNGLQAISGKGLLKIKSGIRDNSIFVLVKDSGKGIPEENFSKLFDPFFTTKDDGTGLGLSITLQIIKAHGGDVEANLLAEGGTEFLILLPQKNGE